jgi:Pvc16 N-terminal domain/IPT/TIG domain
MSNTLAIAAVTQTFSDLLRNVQDNPALGPTTVTNAPPDQAAPDPQNPDRRLNLYLYQVSPNQGWNNADLPIRDSNGNLISQPVLALDLHYLLTAYGLGGEIDTHHLMAHAMSIVHDAGYLDRNAIKASVNATGSPVAGSDLADQIELVTLAPQMLTEEDLYRLWTVFGTSYRLSVGYQVSVVLIERTVATQTAPPVQTSTLTAVPLRTPEITSVSPQPATIPGTLTITGEGLKAPGGFLRFPSGDITPAAANVSPNQIQVALPTALGAGQNTVQVIEPLQLEGSSETRPLFTSNAYPFTVAPVIQNIPSGGLVATIGQNLTVDVSPAIAPSDSVMLVVGKTAIPQTTDPTASPETPTTSATFAITAAVAAGKALVQIQVNGVLSPLEVDTNPASPTFGTYIGPTITVSA